MMPNSFICLSLSCSEAYQVINGRYETFLSDGVAFVDSAFGETHSNIDAVANLRYIGKTTNQDQYWPSN
jgi:hypothetical protein